MIHNVPQVYSLCLAAAGSKFPRSAALFGGYQSPTVPFVRLKNHNLAELFESKQKEIPYSKEDLFSPSALEGDFSFGTINAPMELTDEAEIIYQYSHGGGGYGDVLEREPERVCKDLKNGTTSEWAARNIYKVAFDVETFEYDQKQTELLRDEERKDRLKRALPFEEVEKNG